MIIFIAYYLSVQSVGVSVYIQCPRVPEKIRIKVKRIRAILLTKEKNKKLMIMVMVNPVTVQKAHNREMVREMVRVMAIKMDRDLVIAVALVRVVVVVAVALMFSDLVPLLMITWIQKSLKRNWRNVSRMLWKLLEKWQVMYQR